MRANGVTAILVAIDGKARGAIGIADPVKETTPAALAALKAAGIRVIMLTGDNRITAKAVAAKLGSRLVQSQKAMAAARLTAERKFLASLS